MKNLFLILLGGLLLTAIGCGLSDDDLLDGNLNNFELGHLTAQVNGRAIQYLAVASTTMGSGTGSAILIAAAPDIDGDDQESIGLALAFNDMTEVRNGTYSFSTVCDAFIDDVCISASYEDRDIFVETEDSEESTFTISLELHEATLGPAIRGTFSFTIPANGSNPRIEVSGGKFNILTI